MFVLTGSIEGVAARQVEYNAPIALVSPPILISSEFHSFAVSHNRQRIALFTKSGAYGPECSDKIVKLFDFDITKQPSLGPERASIGVPNVIKVVFSPADTYFAIVSRRSAATTDQPLCRILKAENGELVESFDYPASQECLFAWSGDDSIFAAAFSGGVRFKRAGGEWEKIEVPKFAAAGFVTTPTGALRAAVLYDNQPRRLKIFEYPNLTKELAQRPIVFGDQFRLVLAPGGRSVICIAMTAKSDESYYGDSSAFYLNDEGRQALPFKKRGPVFAIEFGASGNELVTCVGSVPPAVGFWNDRTGGCIELGEFDYNSVAFAPRGRGLVAIGGFGAFGGDFTIYDFEHREVVGHGNAKFTSAWSWSPCGRLILTAVLQQKLTVDNGFCVLNHLGDEAARVPLKELTQAEWFGESAVLPLPALPPKPKAAAVKKAAAYVPPHLRKK